MFLLELPRSPQVIIIAFKQGSYLACFIYGSIIFFVAIVFEKWKKVVTL